MAETQTLPGLSYPPFLDGPPPSRLHSSRIHLPPLSIPGPTRQDYRPPHSAHLAQPIPPPLATPTRLHHRTYSDEPRGVPLSKVLSPVPGSRTPPRLDLPYSPRSPPRSVGEFGGPRSIAQTLHPDRSPYEHSRQPPPGLHASPVERPIQSALSSPAPYATSFYHSSYPPQYPREPQSPHPAQPQGTPHSHPPSPYASHAYEATAASRGYGGIPTPSYAQPQHPDRKPLQLEQPPRSGYLPQRHEELNYELRVRQQPIAARACGFGERDRRVIDPPPIIQLTVSDQQRGQVDLDELRYSLNVVHCTLWSADGTHEETALVQPDRRATRRLMGQLVASPSVAKDEHDNEGCFFCFPDLSCRTHGKYRLRFVLMRIDPANLHVGGTSPILTEVLSDVFTVYTAKDFPGMRPSSALTRALKLQGCNIQVKKGNEKALARKRSAAVSDDGEDDDEKSGAKKQRK